MPAGERSDLRLTDEDWLRQRYVEDGQTVRTIAAELGYSPDTVSRALRTAGIPTRGRGAQPGVPVNVDELVDRYKEGVTVAEIAAETGCPESTVYDALCRADVEFRARSRRPTDPRLGDPGWLRGRYVEDGATAAEMAVELGRGERTVLDALSRHGIPRRRPGPRRLFD
jgi:transposase-like protein